MWDINAFERTSEEMSTARAKILEYRAKLHLDDGKNQAASNMGIYRLCIWNAILAENYRIIDDIGEMKNACNRIIFAVDRKKDEIAKIDNQIRLRGVRESFYKAHLLLAPYSFHHFLLCMEWEYSPEMKFYTDRYCVLKDWARELQCLEEGIYDILGLSAPPRTGKSGIISLLIAWLIGRHPDKSVMYVIHTSKGAKQMRENVYSLITESKRGWARIFPDLKVNVSAEDNWINITPKTYPNNYKTAYFQSIEGAMAGVIEASWMIICDDLISGIEEAMNPSRLETAWQKYSTDVIQRRTNDSVKELHVATRWSTNDVVSRLEAANADNPRAKFIVVPAFDEKYESNFKYKYHPMTKEHFEKIKENMDEISFECIYQQNPIERDGIVFQRDSLSYYEGVLPDGTPDEIVFAADIAFGGGDYLSMPIAYVFGYDAYIHDVVHCNGAKDTTKPMVINAIIANNCERGFMEANNGGDDYAADISAKLKALGVRCLIESKRAPNNKSKLTRILDSQPEIKGQITDGSGYRFHFLSKRARVGKPQYELYMKQLCKFNQSAKFQGKQFDDAADATASLVYNVLNTRKINAALVTLPRKFLNI